MDAPGIGHCLNEAHHLMVLPGMLLYERCLRKEASHYSLAHPHVSRHP